MGTLKNPTPEQIEKLKAELNRRFDTSRSLVTRGGNCCAEGRCDTTGVCDDDEELFGVTGGEFAKDES